MSPATAIPRMAAVLACLWAAPGAAEEIAANSGAGTLRGTLERPDGATRATALILPGSGPTDRDGNNSQGLRTDAYRLLAEGLALHGIATARIDKRGVGDSAGGPGTEASLAAYREDTSAWISVLRGATGADCVWLIGHSEGGYLALDAAGLERVCGLVLLTAPGQPLGALMRDQIARQPVLAPLLPAYDAALDELVAGGKPTMEDLPVALRPIFAPEHLTYLRELFTFHPDQALAATDLPVLVVHGDADFQVPEAQGVLLTAVRPEAPRAVIAGMTHTLKRIDNAVGDGATEANLATYSNPELPLHEDLAPTVAGFILDADG